MTKEPELIGKLISSNAGQLGKTKLAGEWIINSAQSILVQSILEQQKQAHKLELERLKAELKGVEKIEISHHPDYTDEKRVWQFDELCTAAAMTQHDSRQILELFTQNKSEPPLVDEQNKLLAIWRAFNG
ncbi:hypothetical protein R7E46_13240 [Vibrio sp. Vb2704]|uniref:hypothetical protein n=1 Tax=Vibrio sp. Vb2704 TaxID=3074673 RepID=UPI0029647FBC|nr:hypothetical protein [Vibrio sp. Vb2704]MDW1624520.1 hypothetical protein [Vibrio sp. Vb2704]